MPIKPTHDPSKQAAAIERANETLAAAGLPLYGDVSGALARILSLLEAPGNAAVNGRAALRDAAAGARALYDAFPMFDPDAPQPHQLVNRAFSAMPYGGGVGFGVVYEHTSKAEGLEIVAGNLNKLADTLRHVAGEHEKNMAELGEHRSAIIGLSMAFELIDRERARRLELRLAASESLATRTQAG